MSICQASLYAHNILRANHANTPALMYDDTLAAKAQEWAMHIAELNSLTHSSSSFRQGAGENLAYNAAIGIDVYYGVSDAAQAWLVSS